MKNLGFIPVRGGSKRLPRKNLMDLGGKSITHRAIDTALDCGVFAEIILSSISMMAKSSSTKETQRWQLMLLLCCRL